MRKALSDIGFWLILLIICITFLSYKGNAKEAVLLTVLYMPVIIAMGYWITNRLIPKYLLKNYNFRFVLYLIYLLIVGVFLILIINTSLFITIAQLEFKLMPPPTKDFLTLLTFLVLLLLLFVSYKSLKDWRSTYIEKEKASRMMLEKQLRFLQSQLNPHFLFNTLNNIYALSLQKSDKTPSVILKLSNLLDQIVNREQNKLIPLRQEIKAMYDYIAIEALRYGDKLDLNEEVRIEDAERLIPPLFIITLLENAFKHGGDLQNNLSLHYSIIQRGKEINICIRNNYHQKRSAKTGIGTDSLKSQLELLFPNSHHFNVKKEENFFSVSIKLTYHD